MFAVVYAGCVLRSLCSCCAVPCHRRAKALEGEYVGDNEVGWPTNACLVVENPTCSVRALWGCEGLWSYDYGHGGHEYTPPPPKHDDRFPLDGLDFQGRYSTFLICMICMICMIYCSSCWWVGEPYSLHDIVLCFTGLGSVLVCRCCTISENGR